jgi:UDPglucose 6-dehydrogenase
MKLTVAGAGFIGLVSSACLTELGHQITCIDIKMDKIDIYDGRPPIYKPWLESLFGKNLKCV